MSDMARSVEKEAKTVDEAIALALEELGIDQEDVDIEILESGSKAVLGIFGGSKGAKVRVTENISDTKKVAAFFDTLINLSKNDDETSAKYEIHETVQDGQKVIMVNITGEDVAYLIGKYGDTLQALTYVANLIVNKDRDTYKRVFVDVGDYRKHREETLISMANRVASRVAKYKRPVSMEPMSAADRRIIHTALQSNSSVVTESQGEEPNRCVVVKVKPYVKKF